MSYVQAARLGCNPQENPWGYYVQDINTYFLFPNTIATSGKSTGLNAASISFEGQAFFADQVRLGGWTAHAYEVYQSLLMYNYPNMFLTTPLITGVYLNENLMPTSYSLGKQYLSNAFAFTFLQFGRNSLSLVPFNRMNPSSVLVPSFNFGGRAIDVMNGDELNKKNKNNIKWAGLVWLVVNDALASHNGMGVCGKSMVLVCKFMDKKYPGWDKKNDVLGKWWRNINN